MGSIFFPNSLYSEHGLGVTKDNAMAASFYRKAADRGDAEAQFCISRCCALGEGVPHGAIASVH